MDISAIVVALVLVATFLLTIVWIEIHSRKTGPNERRRNAKSSDLEEKRDPIL
jgi:hypothetical protein